MESAVPGRAPDHGAVPKVPKCRLLGESSVPTAALRCHWIDPAHCPTPTNSSGPASWRIWHLTGWCWLRDIGFTGQGGPRPGHVRAERGTWRDWSGRCGDTDGNRLLLYLLLPFVMICAVLHAAAAAARAGRGVGWHTMIYFLSLAPLCCVVCSCHTDTTADPGRWQWRPVTIAGSWRVGGAATKLEQAR